MLAVQRPSMASGHSPSDGTNIGFGWSIDPNSSSLIHDAPAPPPGDPLLTDSDNNFLDSFFENWDTHQFDFGRTFNDPHHNAAPTHSEYWNMPPQFMGTRTSFGQHPNMVPTMQGQEHFGQNYLRDMITPPSASMPPPPHPPAHSTPQPLDPSLLEPTLSAEVIAAAASLLHNPPILRTSSQPHDPFRDNRQPSLGPSIGHIRHQHVADFSTPSPVDRRIARPVGEHDATWADMFHGISRPQQSAPRFPTDLRWGSDVNFGTDQAFMPQSERETTEALEQERIKSMECLEVSQSAATTRPSSPLMNGETSPHQQRTKMRGGAYTGSGFVKAEEEDMEAPPRKRRKSKAKEDVEDEDDENTTGTSKRGGRKSNKSDNVTSEAASGGSRRRKPAAAVANGNASSSNSKQPRENLSESQKRENHIKSEQKRRTVIKEGFDDLSKLVPGLKGSGFSKSTLLTMSGDWLEELITGNKLLREQLESLQGR